jgi:hypothetical protein
MAVRQSEYVIPHLGWGSRLRAVREDIAHMDQRDFAESIGMSHGTYGGHEKRAEVPRGARLIANSIELRWRVPAAWLMEGDAWAPRGSNPQPTVSGFRLAAVA